MYELLIIIKETSISCDLFVAVVGRNDDADGSRQSSATRLRSVEDVGDGPYQMSTAQQQHSGTILCPAVFFVILAFVFGSRPSDHYFRSVCWFVCLPVCLFVCAVFISSL